MGRICTAAGAGRGVASFVKWKMQSGKTVPVRCRITRRCGCHGFALLSRIRRKEALGRLRIITVSVSNSLGTAIVPLGDCFKTCRFQVLFGICALFYAWL